MGRNLAIATDATTLQTPLYKIVGAAETRIWGMTSAERLQRIFRRAGLSPLQDGASADYSVVVAHAGWVFDESLLKELARKPGVILVDDEGVAAAVHSPPGGLEAAEALLGTAKGKAAGLTRLTAAELGSSYNKELRKRAPPIIRRLTDANVREIEGLTFKGSYKGVTDLVTKYVWPTPARIVTRWCALARMTPNQVTFAGFLLVIAAFYLFWTGQFALGLLAGWIMTFLDTVDGKLARVTLTSSKFGNIFDHGIDLIHPPFWWWAWWVGVQAGPHPLDDGYVVLATIVGGYGLQRLTELVFVSRFGMHMHAWRPFDSFFRLITARRNPNLLLLTGAAVAGRPDIGLLLVAVWTAISLLVHVGQVLQAMGAPAGQVTSWLDR